MSNVFKLPHPIRIVLDEERSSAIKKEYEYIDSFFADIDVEGYSLECLNAYLVSKDIGFIKGYLDQGMTSHQARILLAATTLFPFKYMNDKGTVFTTSDEIDSMLLETEIAKDIPISYLRLPFKNCYIEFTESRVSPLKVFNHDSGEHILEGVYLTETTIQPNSIKMDLLSDKCGIDKSKDVRIIDMMFIGSPLEKEHYLDDALRVQSIYIQDDPLTIDEQLEQISNAYGSDKDFSNDLSYLKKMLQHISKVLLFMNCKQYRDTAFNERKELVKKISSLKSNSKIKRYKRKLRQSYDRVVIKPSDEVKYVSSIENENESAVEGRRSHWRKGHLRMQAYGKNMKKRKLIFIEPIIVGRTNAEKKKYSITEK